MLGSQRNSPAEGDDDAGPMSVRPMEKPRQPGRLLSCWSIAMMALRVPAITRTVNPCRVMLAFIAAPLAGPSPGPDECNGGPAMPLRASLIWLTLPRVASAAQAEGLGLL